MNSQMELLFNYCDRFFQRLLMTRKAVKNDLLSKMETLLNHYFDQQSAKNRLPTVQYLADQFGVSPSHLSDLLRSLTGLNAQQHIHQKMIEKAKIYLVSGELSIAEIAYRLGFRHPPSFTRIFKRKTNLCPHQFQNQSQKGIGSRNL